MFTSHNDGISLYHNRVELWYQDKEIMWEPADPSQTLFLAPLITPVCEIHDIILKWGFSVYARCNELDYNKEMLRILQTWLVHPSVPILWQRSSDRAIICRNGANLTLEEKWVAPTSIDHVNIMTSPSPHLPLTKNKMATFFEPKTVL